MVTLALCLVLAAAAVPAELKVAAPGLTLNGLDKELAAPLTDQLAKPLAPVRVITPRDIAALLGLERQKELLGCTTEGSSCMAELGNALGVQGVLLGDVVKLGGEIQLSARIIDPVDGKPLASASSRVSSESELFDALTRLGFELRSKLYASLRLLEPPPVVEAPSARRGTRRFFPIPLAVGGASLIAGGVCLGVSESAYQRLTGGMPGSIASADAPLVAQNGQSFQLAGAVLVAVAAAALLAGLALLLFGSRDP